jgi:CheY-like chemotaxis protein
VRVLIVEDHAKLAMTVATGLRQAGMAVDVVFDGGDALDHIAETPYDVVVLDRDLPGLHGDDVCRAIVAEGAESRVLMLTAAGAVEDRVIGLGLGADDYLAKPSGRWAVVLVWGSPRRWSTGISRSTLPKGSPPEPEPACRSIRKSSRSWNCSSEHKERWCRANSFWSGCGTRPPTRSARP